ncbi:TolC family protein [Fimbriiglobus ruber]|uniref:Outer membrane protein n=1 Tax=Fimbriiglobus ruber TaxID=1908690 RepID=A0A225DYW5_9BACT|nr:TolC family protein [Fimbriiglobus ruber]OWK46720.1 Outer membrane protein [Fimbriiglobus ruber]
MRGGAAAIAWAFALAALSGRASGQGAALPEVPVPPTPPSVLPAPATLLAGQSPLPPTAVAQIPGERVLPINLATALHLAGAKPLDVQIAGRQVELAARQLDRAKLLWVPNLVVGTDYFYHDGSQQSFTGDVVQSSRGALAAGVGPNIVFNVSDAIYAPLAARQDFQARQAALRAVANDTALAVAEVYFALQQARGELAGAVLATRKAQEVSRRATSLAEGLAPPLEATRARVELARRQQAEATARERWRTTSAELTRILRLDSAALLEPVEPPFLPITVVQENATVDVLIPLALSTRPELAAQQAVVRATLARLKQEKLRPLVPSLALRSVSTNPSGSIGYGAFAGGSGNQLSTAVGRFDMDVQVLWEFQALGFGNRVRAGERRVEHEAATLELFRTQDRIAAEVVTAHAQAKSAAERLALSEPALKDAVDLVDKSLEGLGQTRRAGDFLTLVVRPQEVVAAVQALGQANTDFHAAVGDYNRAQFRLYRALGHPAQYLASSLPSPPAATPPAATLPAASAPQPGVGR